MPNNGCLQPLFGRYLGIHHEELIFFVSILGLEPLPASGSHMPGDEWPALIQFAENDTVREPDPLMNDVEMNLQTQRAEPVWCS